MAQVGGFTKLDTERTLGAWKAVSDDARSSFAHALAKQMGAHSPSLYGEDVRRCLDDKAKVLPPDTHIGTVIDDCAERVPTEAELLASRTVAVNMSKSAKLKIVPFVTDDVDEEEWTRRGVAGLEPDAKIRSTLFLKLDAIKPGAHAEDIIKTLKARPDWVTTGRDDELWLHWFDGRCPPVVARVGLDGKLRMRGDGGLCARPGLSRAIEGFPEDESACSLHPEITHCTTE